MRKFSWVCSFSIGFASALTAQSAPNFYRATSVKGAIAYQSQSDNKQFFYIPTQTENLLGDRLKTFRVSYYGIGNPFYVTNSATGTTASSVGAILSATASIGLDDATRKRLTAQIERDFKVKSPKLAPIPISNAKVRSLLLDDALSVSKLGQVFSTNPGFEQEFAFSAGAKDNLFAQLLATSDNSGAAAVQANPHFAVEILGETEFVGDPWKINVSCDLAQVWKQVRAAASASVSIGWFRLGEANYNSVNQQLERSGACKYQEIPGNLLDRDKNLLPILEMTRRIFEQVNAEARGGQGFFKFEPNPEAPAVSAAGAKSVWPWSVSINLGYSAAHFTQALSWKTEVEIGTRFSYPISATTAIAVTCNNTTKQFFQDLANTAENCITQEKIDILMKRLAQEKAIVNKKLAELEEKLIAGIVSREIYDLLYKRWTTESQSEGSITHTKVYVKQSPENVRPTDSISVIGFGVAPVGSSVDDDIAWARQELQRIKRP